MSANAVRQRRYRVGNRLRVALDEAAVQGVDVRKVFEAWFAQFFT